MYVYFENIYRHEFLCLPLNSETCIMYKYLSFFYCIYTVCLNLLPFSYSNVSLIKNTMYHMQSGLSEQMNL